MGSFEDHLRYGVIAHFCVLASSLSLYYGLNLDIPKVVLPVTAFLFPVTIAGATFPDIDHPHSKPYRAFRKTVAAMAGLSIGLVVYVYNDLVASILSYLPVSAEIDVLVGVVLVCLMVLFAVGGWWMIGFLRPPHRGPTHRLPIGLLVSGVIGVGVNVTALLLASSQVAALFAIVAGVCFFIGFLSHLHCDGMLGKRKTYLTLR